MEDSILERRRAARAAREAQVDPNAWLAQNAGALADVVIEEVEQTPKDDFSSDEAPVDETVEVLSGDALEVGDQDAADERRALADAEEAGEQTWG